jgi:hypothetical protein
MRISYPISWQEPDGSLGSGRLEVGAQALLLDGRNGAPVKRAIPYEEISAVRVARSNERLQGRPTLLVDLNPEGTLRIAGVAGPGIVSELAARLSALHPDRRLAETRGLS